ncbi:MAG: imelysin family protein [Daejeonella sp.]
MMNIGKKAGFVLLLLLAGIIACSKKGTPEVDKPGNATDRQAMLVNIADNIVLPSYDNFKAKFDIMLAKSEAFTSNPTKIALTDFRAAWVNAYIQWQKVELFEFGPAERYVLRSYFNVYPAIENSVNSNIASGTSNLDLPSNYNAQGFPALDYLINGLGNSDEVILSNYTTASDASKRIVYLKKIITQMNTVFTQVYSEWKGSYRDIFINKTGVDASSSTSTMVNGVVHNYERSIRSGKFGIPSGIMLNGTLSPEKVEAFYRKDISLTLAKTAHQATTDFFNGKSVKNGTEGPSFKTYLGGLSALDSKTQSSLAQALNNQFSITSQKLNAINTENLNSVVLTNNQLMIDVYNEMQKSVRMLKVDMTSAMSITITYTDNDGD